MSLLLDGITVLIIVSFALASYKRGFINAAVRLVGTIASLVAAMAVSEPAAEYIFESFLAGPINEAVSRRISSVSFSDLGSFTDGMAGILRELPGFLSELVAAGLGQNAQSWYEKVIGATGETAAAVTGAVIAPMVTGFLRALIFFAVFTLLAMLVNLIAKPFSLVNAIPLIGSLNELLGALLGAAQGALYMFVIASIVWLALAALGGAIGPVTAGAVEQTLLFKEFYSFGPWAKASAGLL